jgi:hypothetical protein
MTNSLLNPADSLTPILHFPNRVTYRCYYCDESIHFHKGLNRWATNDTLDIRCKEAK